MSFCIPKDSEPLSVQLIQKQWVDQEITDPYEIIVTEYNQIHARFEINMIMHRLTAEYYHNRSFWLTFLPLLVVAAAVSVCGLIGTGSYNDSMIEGGDVSGGEDEEGGFEMPEIESSTMSLIVGLLGVLSTTLASLGKHLNYQSKGDMHAVAANTLKGLIEEFEFGKLEVQHKKRMDNSYGKTKERNVNLQSLRIKIDSHQDKFDLIEKSFDVPVPNKIKHAFTCLDQHALLIPRSLRFDHYKRYYNDLHRAMQTRSISCLTLPSVDVEKMFKNRILRDVDAIWNKLNDKEQAEKAKGSPGGGDESDDDASESGEENAVSNENTFLLEKYAASESA